MRSLRLAVPVLLAVLASIPHLALGQPLGGRIDGRVMDRRGEPLAGIELHLRGEALPPGRRSVTGPDGGFRFLHLPPGTYDLTVSGDGWATLEQTQVEVRVGQSVFLDLEMIRALDEDEDEVAITGWAPVLDVGSISVETGFPRPLFERLPLLRTFDGVLSLVPGAVPVGGPAPAIHGAGPFDTRTFLDGLEATDPVSGASSLLLPWELVGDARAVTGGHPAARQGALGGVLDLVTRPGSQGLQATAFAWATGEELTRDSPDFLDVDGGLTVGGTLVRDRLWGFAGGDLRRREGRQELFGPGAREAETFYYLARLDVEPAAAHRLSLSAAGDPTDLTFRHGSDEDPVELDLEGGGRRWGATYAGVGGRRLAGTLAVGAYEQDGPAREAERQEARGAVTLFTGSRAGFSQQLRAGARIEEVDAIGRATVTERSLFLEDQVRMGPFLTLHLGLRLEDFEARGPTVGATIEDDRLAPRVGFAWDLWRRARSRLFGYHGRVHDAPAVGLLPFAGTPAFAGFELPALEETLLGLEMEPLPNISVGWVARARDFEESGGPAPRPDYEALEMFLRKRFASGWQLHAGYVNADDPSPLGRRHQARVWGSYLWAGRLTTGALVRYLSDAPEAAGRLAAPDLALFDLRLSAPVTAGPVVLLLHADLLNLTDERDGIVLEGPEPRTVRLGVEVEW